MTRTQTHPQRAPSWLISIRGGFSSTLPNQLSIHLPIHFRENSALSALGHTELHHKDKSLKKGAKNGKRDLRCFFVFFFSSVFKESDESLIYIVSFIDKTCFYCIGLSQSGRMCDPSYRTRNKLCTEQMTKAGRCVFNP